MAIVVPTVLATSAEEYTAMLATAEGLGTRIHVDICDGEFAPNSTINLAQVHFAEITQADLHLMLKDPASQLETALSLHPYLIIFHAESDGDIVELMGRVKELGVKAGIALLPDTSVDAASNLVAVADHVLIFTGTLGFNGGAFQESQLDRVAAVRAINPDVEVSVDGGVSDANAAMIAAKGVDVLYAGGSIQNAKDPKAAYSLINTRLTLE